MINESSRAARLVLIRRSLLALAVGISAAAATVLGFASYLFVQGYSGGSDPQSVAPLAFPIALGIFALVGLPVTLACVGSWMGYVAAARRSRQFSR